MNVVMKLNKKHPLYQEDLENVLSTKGLDSLRGKSVLVTGATGLIGVHLIDALMLLGNVKVYAVGRNKNKAAARLGEYYNNTNFAFIEQDVCQPFPEDLQTDCIISLASNTHPMAYSNYPVETIMTNVKGAEHALELARKCHATVLYPSSVEVYGNSESPNLITEDYTGDLNLSTARACYTESKRVCEAMCQSYLSEFGVVVKIARLSRVFGPTMLESDSKASSQFIKKALAYEDVVLKSKGDQFFSYTYVTDAVAAMLYILKYGELGSAYNISNENCNVRLKDFAQVCADYEGKEVVFKLPSEKESKGYSVVMNAVLDNSKLRSLGFVPKYEFSDAVYRTIEILK
jgi:nucleoside-diphosphate-sugar epimerase